VKPTLVSLFFPSIGMGAKLAGISLCLYAALSCSAQSTQNYSYGSGAFGLWMEDDNGAPAYSYALDQTTNPLAVYNATIDPYQRLPTDHLFHLGNDRLVALASNYGYVSIRTDEGGPKLLNDFFPGSNQYGGGVGYLTAKTTGGDGALLLSTFYNHTGDCASNRFERHFGVGYVRKVVDGCSSGAAATVTQDIIVPAGTDPVVVSVVTVTNTGSSASDFTWTESWAAAWYHLDLYSRQLQYADDAAVGSNHSRPLRSGSGVPSYLADFRAFVANHYTPVFAPVTTGAFTGVQAGYTFTGLTPGDINEMARIQLALKTEAATNAFVGPVQTALPPGATLWDDAPPMATLLDVSQVRAN
jgi:hypothetical protein